MDSNIEYIAVALGVLYVLLATRSIVWCWPAGILSSLLYIYINTTHALYQDAILQSYYVVAGIYGWFLWSRKENSSFANDNRPSETLSIRSISLMEHGKLILAGALLVPVFGYVFSLFGNSLSYFDAGVTIFSFIATWMTAKRILENWLYWILIDVVAAFMYYIKNLTPTSILYLFFALIAVYGYFEWKKKQQAA